MKNLALQAVKFIGISGIGWLFDFCIYTGLGVVSQDFGLNNTISSWVGVTFVFIFATKKVFENNSKMSLKWKYLIYLGYQAVLIFLTSKLLEQVNLLIMNQIDIQVVISFSAMISKIFITPITMILNFLVMKNVIEKI